MTSPHQKPNPFNVVAIALGCARDTLTNDSAMYKDHGWDSFGHVSVITAIEEACGIRIANHEIMKYSTMAAIVELFESRSEMGRRAE